VVVSRFEQELDRAAQEQATAAAAMASAAQSAGEQVYRKNAQARAEAMDRLVHLGGYVRNFLVKHEVRPVQVMAGTESRFRNPHLVSLCSGWWLSPTFLRTDGKLVEFARAKRRMYSASDFLSGRIKPGQQYIGRFDDPRSAVRPYDQGVGSAMFIDSTQLPVFSSVAEFNRFYYGELHRPLADLPIVHEALLLPGDDSALYLVRLNSEDGNYGMTAVHEELRASALKLAD
jgi:hypothetical protein